MKSFRFRLERVLNWRQTQLAMESARLEGLFARQHDLEERLRAVAEQSAAMQAQLGAILSMSGADLARLESIRVWGQREERRLWAKITEVQRTIGEQQSRVRQATHRLRLLDKLKKHQRAEWQAASDKESEDLVADLTIARWRHNS